MERGGGRSAVDLRGQILMAEDEVNKWIPRESIDIEYMRQILRGMFLDKDYGEYVKDANDVLEAFAELCGGLKQVFCGVKTLKVYTGFYYRELTDAGLLALTTMLEAGYFNDLQELVISNFRTGNFQVAGERLCRLFESGHLNNLRSLDLSGTGFRGEGMKTLAKSLQSSQLSKLEALRLCCFTRTGDGAVQALADTFASGHLCNLRKLDLSSTYMGAEGAQFVGKWFLSGHLNVLESLNLRNTHLDNVGAESLAEAFASEHVGNLRILDLSLNFIRAKGIESLFKSFLCGKLKKLEALDLLGTDLGGTGIESLAVAFASGHLGEKLESLNLRESNLRNEGAQSLAKSFYSGNLSKLETLDLPLNQIGDVGAEALVRSFQFGKFGKLSDLDLSDNVFGGRGLQALAEALKSERLRALRAVNTCRDSSAIIEIGHALETGSLGSLKDLLLFSAWRQVSPAVQQAFSNSYQKNPFLIARICTQPEASANTHDTRELNTLRQRNEERVAKLMELQTEEEVSGEHGKVFLCGNGGVGKTTLTTTLMEGRSRRSEKREATRGIEVSNMESKSSREQPVTLALWDLAGQHDYEVLHSAFLPDLSFSGGQATFFVIVCNANSGKNSLASAKEHLAYWLRFISSNSIQDINLDRRRRVFVVLNCFDGDKSGHEVGTWTHFLADCQGVFGRFLNLFKDPFILNAMNRSEVKPFKHLLMEEAGEMLKKRKMPKICLTVQGHGREWVKDHERYPVLSWNHYLSVAGKGIFEEGKLSAVAEYLHEAGHLILFKRGVDPQIALSDPESSATDQTLVIVDPQWFCRDVVGNLLLPDHMLRESEEERGVLRRAYSRSPKLPISTLEKLIFETSEVPREKIDEVVVLLSRIGLCYQLPDMTDKIFIPSLIQTNNAPGWSDGTWNRGFDERIWVMGFALEVKNWEATLLPIVVLRKLQVNLALDKDIGGRPDCNYWVGKSCIRFKYNGMDALVEYFSDLIPSEAEQGRIDVLVKPLVDELCALRRREQTNLAQEMVNRILHITKNSCPGVELEKRIIKPWSVSEGWKPVMERDIQVSVHDLKGRVEANGELQRMEWIVGNERVEEEDILSEEDLVSLQNLIAAKLIDTEEALKQYGLIDYDGVEPVQHLGEAEQSKFSDVELTSNNPEHPDTVLLLKAMKSLFRDMQDSQEIHFRDMRERLEDVKTNVEVLSKRQHSWNRKIQNLERFSIEEKEVAVPRFAYLTKGTQKWWVKVKERVVETVSLHFLCEASYEKGTFHEVEGQKGIDVRKIKDWATTLVPILVWTFKVTIVAAKIAGNVALPGLGLLFSSEGIANTYASGILMAPGIAELAKYLDEALDTALDHDQCVPETLREGNTSGVKRSKWVLGQERQLRGNARTAVHQVLKNLKQKEMVRQVGLKRVWLDDNDDDRNHVVWICDQCYMKYGSRAHDM